MQDTITCPACKRRLVLPPGVRDIVAQCPRCQTQFPSHPAAPEPAALRADASPPPAQATPEPGPPRIDIGTPVPEGNPSGVPGMRWGWLVGMVLFGLLRLLLRGEKDRPSPVPDVRTRGVVRVVQAKQNEIDEIAAAKEMKDLLAKSRKVLADAHAREFQPLFDDLRRGFRAADGRALLACFDVDRMADEVIAIRPVAKPPLIRSLELSLPGLLEKQAQAMAWASLDVGAVTRLGDDEAIVDTRLVKADGGTREVRWWMVRSPGGWRVYDMKDLERGEKLSLSAASAPASP